MKGKEKGNPWPLRSRRLIEDHHPKPSKLKILQMKSLKKKFTKEIKDKSQVVRYKCKKPKHFKFECPNLENEKEKKKSFFKNKKGFMVTWTDLDLSSLEERYEEANFCFMIVTTFKNEEDDGEVIFHDLNIFEKKISKLTKEFDKRENESIKEEKCNDLSKDNTYEVNEHPPNKSSISHDKKKYLNKGKSTLHCIKFGKFGHLSYDCGDCPKKRPSKTFRTNKKGPKTIWIPKNLIIPIAYLLNSKKDTPIMVLL
ncbi:hypothetical protein CR513_44299, partial [Mucuna pruriens]